MPAGARKAKGRKEADAGANQYGLSEPDCWDFLPEMLQAADKDEDWRSSAKALGLWLRRDACYRAILKRTRKVGAGKSWWKWIESEIGRLRPKDPGPWWEILKYADRGEVSAETQRFFEGTGPGCQRPRQGDTDAPDEDLEGR